MARPRAGRTRDLGDDKSGKIHVARDRTYSRCIDTAAAFVDITEVLDYHLASTRADPRATKY